MCLRVGKQAEDLIRMGDDGQEGSCPCGRGLMVWGGRELLLLEVGSPRGTQLSRLGREWKELVDTKDNWL